MPVHLSKLLPGTQKNCSHIINDRTIFSCSLYYGRHQRFKYNDKSSSIPVKVIELFYHLIRRLLFTSKINRSNVQDCVMSLLTTMELPMNYHKNIILNTDLLFTKKIQTLVLSSVEDQYTHYKTLFYEHKNYIPVILQEIIHLQRFKKVSTVLKGVLKKIIELLDTSLYMDLTNNITDHQNIQLTIQEK